MSELSKSEELKQLRADLETVVAAKEIGKKYENPFNFVPAHKTIMSRIAALEHELCNGNGWDYAKSIMLTTTYSQKISSDEAHILVKYARYLSLENCMARNLKSRAEKARDEAIHERDRAVLDRDGAVHAMDCVEKKTSQLRRERNAQSAHIKKLKKKVKHLLNDQKKKREKIMGSVACSFPRRVELTTDDRIAITVSSEDAGRYLQVLFPECDWIVY